MRQILEFFCIPFDSVTTGSYDASNSGVFSIPFDSVTTGSYDASNSGGFFAYLLILRRAIRKC